MKNDAQKKENQFLEAEAAHQPFEAIRWDNFDKSLETFGLFVHEPAIRRIWDNRAHLNFFFLTKVD